MYMFLLIVLNIVLSTVKGISTASIASNTSSCQLLCLRVDKSGLGGHGQGQGGYCLCDRKYYYNGKALVYSFGIGEDILFEEELSNLYHV